MKNLYLLSTEKTSRLVKNSNENKLYLCIQNILLDKEIYCYPQNLYIISDEEPKYKDYYITDGKQIYYCNTINPKRNNQYKKIILTTDQDLIKDGVQAIDDEFLEWFVKNSSCEMVEIDLLPYDGTKSIDKYWVGEYKIIIPDELFKQKK